MAKLASGWRVRSLRGRSVARGFNRICEMALIDRDTHCESKAEFAELLRRWYDTTGKKTIGDLAQVAGVTKWVSVRTGGRDFRVHADTNREGVRRYLELVGLHGPGLAWYVERSRSGRINKVCVEPDRSATKGLFVYATTPLDEPAVV
jgi:hypothetical protein